MTDKGPGEPGAVRPHLHYHDPIVAIGWLCRVFDFREQVRMDRGGGNVTSRLVGPDGGVVMVSGLSDEFKEWMRQRVQDFHEPLERGWPYLSHAISVHVVDVNAHYQHVCSEGGSTLTTPTDQPWGIRSYAALDLDGHQWEFAETLRTVEPEAWGAIRVDSVEP